jgi:hypothetical protein
MVAMNFRARKRAAPLKLRQPSLERLTNRQFPRASPSKARFDVRRFGFIISTLCIRFKRFK